MQENAIEWRFNWIRNKTTSFESKSLAKAVRNKYPPKESKYRLFRGLTFKDELPDEFRKEKTELRLKNLSAWSLDPRIAFKFAMVPIINKKENASKFGILLELEVDKTKIAADFSSKNRHKIKKISNEQLYTMKKFIKFINNYSKSEEKSIISGKVNKDIVELDITFTIWGDQEEVVLKPGDYTSKIIFLRDKKVVLNYDL